MGTAQNLKGLLEIAVVRQRTTETGQQSFVAGMSNGGLLQDGDRLRPLPRRAQRLSIPQRRLGIVGMGVIAIVVEVQAAGGSRFFGFVAERPRNVRQSVGLAAAKPKKQDGRQHRHGTESRKAERPGQSRVHFWDLT